MTVTLSLARLFAPGLIGLLAFAGTAAEKAESPHTKDSLETVKQRLDEDKAVLLDVREKMEWEEGHLKQARLLPLTEIGKRLDEPGYLAELKESLPTGKPIYLHCKAGGRCVIAAKDLKKALGDGYDFRPLKPGYEDLLEAGFEKAEE
jgi:rhodanese-related sulfurtransferase